MNLQLSGHEVTLLIEALDRYLPELEFELARIKLERNRHQLVELDRVLLQLRDRLTALQEQGEATEEPPDAPPPAA